MTALFLLEDIGLKGFDDFKISDVEFGQNLCVQTFCHDQQFSTGVDGDVGKLRMKADGQVGRNCPGGRCPDNERQRLTSKLVKACRQLVLVWELDEYRWRGVVFVLNLGFRQGGYARGTPVNRFASLVEAISFGKAGKLTSGCRFVIGGHGQIGMLPVTEDAETAEFITLDVDPFFGVGAALFANLGLGHLPFFLAQFLIDFQLDRQAMAIPAGDVRRIIALHALTFDDDIFEDLVQRMTNVNVAIGIGGAVVQSEVGLLLVRLAKFAVEFQFGPALHDFRFALWQVATHREIGCRKIKRLFVVHIQPRRPPFRCRFEHRNLSKWLNKSR